MHPLRTFLLAILAAMPLFGATAPRLKTDEFATRARLTRQAEAWEKAMVAKDLAGIAANMCDDFRLITPNGAVQDREAFLRDLMSLELQIEPFTADELEIRLYGDTAVVSGRRRTAGQYAGAPFSMDLRYIDVYVRRGDGWKVCNAQATPIAQ